MVCGYLKLVNLEQILRKHPLRKLRILKIACISQYLHNCCSYVALVPKMPN